MNNDRGFTLTELIIVVAIIGILAAIALPAYMGQQRNAARTEAYANLQALRLLEEKFFAENGSYPPTTGNAGADQPGNIALIQAPGVLPDFRPGTGLNFSYQIVNGSQITAATMPPGFGALANCFTAIATGNTGTRVAGEVYAIDCNNNKNF